MGTGVIPQDHVSFGTVFAPFSSPLLTASSAPKEILFSLEFSSPYSPLAALLSGLVFTSATLRPIFSYNAFRWVSSSADSVAAILLGVGAMIEHFSPVWL